MFIHCFMQQLFSLSVTLLRMHQSIRLWALCQCLIIKPYLRVWENAQIKEVFNAGYFVTAHACTGPSCRSCYLVLDGQMAGNGWHTVTSKSVQQTENNRRRIGRSETLQENGKSLQIRLNEKMKKERRWRKRWNKEMEKRNKKHNWYLINPWCNEMDYIET